jgi:hypothetical protein
MCRLILRCPARTECTRFWWLLALGREDTCCTHQAGQLRQPRSSGTPTDRRSVRNHLGTRHKCRLRLPCRLRMLGRSGLRCSARSQARTLHIHPQRQHTLPGSLHTIYHRTSADYQKHTVRTCRPSLHILAHKPRRRCGRRSEQSRRHTRSTCRLNRPRGQRSRCSVCDRHWARSRPDTAHTCCLYLRLCSVPCSALHTQHTTSCPHSAGAQLDTQHMRVRRYCVCRHRAARMSDSPWLLRQAG